MKNILFLTAFSLACFAFTSTPPKAVANDALEVIQDHSVVGNWRIDTTYFINDGVKTDGEPPLFDARWIFKADGTCSLSDNASTYTRDGDKLNITVFGGLQEYTLLEISGTTMRVQSTIVETADMSMKMESKLTRME